MANSGTSRLVDPYARLGLAPGASLANVKRAYRRLAMDSHPDRAGSGDLETFLAVKAAYESIVAQRSVGAHRSVVEPGDRRRSAVAWASAASRVRPDASIGAYPASGAAHRSSWPGGRWYWEGRREPSSKW